MFERKIRGTVWLLAGVLVASTGACVADDDADVETAPATEQPAPPAATSSGFTDDLVVRVLDVVNRGEIQEAELARSKSQNQEVRRFADMMITDHQRLASETQPGGAAGTPSAATPGTTGTGAPGTQPTTPGATTPPATGTGTGTNPPSTTPSTGAGTNPPSTGAGTPGASTATPGAPAQHGVHTGTPEQIIQQMQQESDSIRAAWQNLSGAEFDRAYIDRQVTAHQNALDLLDQQLMPGVQDAQLRQSLTNARPVIQSHLDEARRLQQSIGSSTGAAPR